jgi:hypothetical protein
VGGAGDAEEEEAVDVDEDGTGDAGTTLVNALDDFLAVCVALLGSGDATATMLSLVGVAAALTFSRALGVGGGAAFFFVFVGFSVRDEGAYL